MVGRKVVVLREALSWPSMDGGLALALCLMLAGGLAVVLLDRAGRSGDRPQPSAGDRPQPSAGD